MAAEIIREESDDENFVQQETDGTDAAAEKCGTDAGDEQFLEGTRFLGGSGHRDVLLSYDKITNY
jgi:hypothetical protein